MAVQKIEVEIDIEDGYEFVRLDKHTCNNPHYYQQGVVKLNGIMYFVIARKAWQWPEWLLAEWIAMDQDDDWWAFGEKPFINSSGNFWNAKLSMELDADFVAFTPPPCTDWTQSLRRNPKAKVTQ